MLVNTVVRFHHRQHLGLLLALMALSIAMASESFHSVVTSNGFSLCAVDNPSYSMSVDDILGIPFGVPDQVRCGYACTVETVGDPCLAFNVINSQCQFYNSTTNHCFAAWTTCVYTQVKHSFGFRRKRPPIAENYIAFKIKIISIPTVEVIKIRTQLDANSTIHSIHQFPQRRRLWVRFKLRA